MPISNGFSQDPNPNPNYYVGLIRFCYNLYNKNGFSQVHKPGKTEYLDESIYYKREVPYEKPVEVFIKFINIYNKFILKGCQTTHY